MMKVVYSKEFRKVYTGDPAAARGRIEPIVEAISGKAEFVEAVQATEEQIALAHEDHHIESIRRQRLFDIAALAAGGAVQAARIGLEEPAFALIRPPGHHASADSAWGFCFFNNMSIALLTLKREGLINTAFVLDFDLHYGDGNVNILGDEGWVKILNPDAPTSPGYVGQVRDALEKAQVDIIGVSAGFDNHEEDWGGLLSTGDYTVMGRMVRETAERNKGGCFAILEGGYNHDVLGQNVSAFLDGFSR